MKQTKGKILKLFLAAFMLITVSGAAMTVHAASAPKLSAKSLTVYMGCTGSVELTGVSSFEQLKGLKYSNSKVAYITPGIISKNKLPLYVYATKTGKTTISLTAKNKKLSLAVNVVKYTNPCASLKLGSKNYASKYKKSSFANITKPGGKCKISVKAKSGWKVESILGMTNSGKTKKLKNGKTISTNSYNSINIVYTNKKTKGKITTTLFWE